MNLPDLFRSISSGRDFKTFLLFTLNHLVDILYIPSFLVYKQRQYFDMIFGVFFHLISPSFLWIDYTFNRCSRHGVGWWESLCVYGLDVNMQIVLCRVKVCVNDHCWISAVTLTVPINNYTGLAKCNYLCQSFSDLLFSYS